MSRYIITLSSIPPRFDALSETLDSLLAQTVPAERIILYINDSYLRFPDWDGTLPVVPEGVEIRRVAEHWGPATKVLPALRDFADEDVDILFCDDDQIYAPYLAERMLNERKRRPEVCIGISPMEDYAPPVGQTRRAWDARPRVLRLWKVTNVLHRLQLGLANWRARRTGVFYEPLRRHVMRSGYADGFEGFMGVLVRPRFFPPEVFDLPDFARPVDDVWLSGHATRAGHPPWILGGFSEPVLMPRSKPAHLDETALHRNDFDGRDRDDSNLEVVRYFQETYGLWR